ncbi:uncharacterized protein EHS24_004472 [Apiotrichum porosum]|uniref:Uncharacterized protein n=1 Tax=Apiotrichum porosum TaxID=105984 RepID=A0A427Y583_9TREE|nr:uncharacterized protein EHS24_004472 [Apiotrichum porosum]RSH86235.1 hypothetical protein EHS24_004472 [Apiotrichum porosum]
MSKNTTSDKRTPWVPYCRGSKQGQNRDLPCVFSGNIYQVCNFCNMQRGLSGYIPDSKRSARG